MTKTYKIVVGNTVAVLVALFQWGIGADFWTLFVAYLVVQGLDGNLLVPVLFSEAVSGWSKALPEAGSIVHASKHRARVVELVDTQVLGTCAFGRRGSSPLLRTK